MNVPLNDYDSKIFRVEVNRLTIVVVLKSKLNIPHSVIRNLFSKICVENVSILMTEMEMLKF